MERRRAAGSGFTLVEILIVVLLLGIIAAIALPRFTTASSDARESSLCTDLQTLRRRIEIYKGEHRDRGPHLDENGEIDTDNFIARMTGKTNEYGKCVKGGDRGPYLFEWPANPFANAAVADQILFGKFSRPPRNDKTGWYYSITSGILSANTSEGAKSLDPPPMIPGAVPTEPVEVKPLP